MAATVLTAWETGRLRELIPAMSEADDLDSKKFLDLLVEAGIVSALNVAEAIKTRIAAIRHLEEMIKGGNLERDVRDIWRRSRGFCRHGGKRSTKKPA